MFYQRRELTTERLQFPKDAFPDVPNATVFWDALSADPWRAAPSATATTGPERCDPGIGRAIQGCHAAPVIWEMRDD
ncbi:MAG TPA: hypothetical protein VMU87_03570 [Stellaceae bacterium]|nr:hypothetical protein [Stellaceae bacterium]